MDTDALMHMNPTIDMLAEAISRAGIACKAYAGDEAAGFSGARMYVRGAEPDEHTIYVLRPADAAAFPIERFAWAGDGARPGRGGAIVCPGCDPDRLLDILLQAFDACRRAEARLDELVYRNAGLDALCELGAELLDNPICIHDDWFVMIAKSSELPEVMPPDYIMSSSKEFIPQIIVEDFKNDSDYLETYAFHTAQLWDASPGRPNSVYVNLWEGSLYRGRLLVVQYHRAFRAMDYLLAELLAQRAMRLLAMKQLGVDRPHRSMDDIVYDILTDRSPDAQEITQLLRTLHWQPDDRVLCIRLKNQETFPSVVMEHALHSDLFRTFPDGYIMFTERQQCVLVNLSRERVGLSMVRHALAPLCRDYCLYAGMSSPVNGVREWRLGWIQAGEALDCAFALQSEKWIVPFSDCVLDYLMTRLPPMGPLNLVSPQLNALIDYDREKGTPYFETLRAYLLCERDIPRTSERLIIHRTTLLYRLKKIGEIAKIDMDDPWKRLYLLLSLWILEREKGGI